MAVDKIKVLAALSLKFKGKSLSKTFLDKTATRYAAKIETDADLDDYINDREDDILAAGEEADRRVTAATKKLTTEPGKPAKTEEPEIDDDDLKDAPAYVKVMMKKMQGMEDQIKASQAEKTAQTLSQRFVADARLKGIDAKLLKGWHPKTEEEFEEAVTTAAEELKDYIKPTDQQQPDGTVKGLSTKIGQSIGDRPNHTTLKTPAADKSKEVPPEIKTFTDNLNKVNKVQTT